MQEFLSALVTVSIFIIVPFIPIVLIALSGIVLARVCNKFVDKIFAIYLIPFFIILALGFFLPLSTEDFRKYNHSIMFYFGTIAIPIASICFTILFTLSIQYLKQTAIRSTVIGTIGFCLVMLFMTPIHAVYLDKLEIYPLKSSLHMLDLYKNTNKQIALNVPKILFSSPKYRYPQWDYFAHISENSINDFLSPKASLTVCFPSMRPASRGCTDNNEELQIHVHLEKLRNTSETPGKLKRRKRKEYTKLITPLNPLTGTKTNFFFKCAHVTTHKTGKNCMIPFCKKATQPTLSSAELCRRTPLDGGRLLYTYSIPYQSLDKWPEYEKKISGFLSSFIKP